MHKTFPTAKLPWWDDLHSILKISWYTFNASLYAPILSNVHAIWWRCSTTSWWSLPWQNRIIRSDSKKFSLPEVLLQSWAVQFLLCKVNSHIQSDIHRTHASQNCARMGFIDPSIDPREQRDGDVRGCHVVLQFNRFGRTNDNVFQYYTVYSRTNY